jgi:3-methyladenine DNA glycosylase AlkC
MPEPLKHVYDRAYVARLAGALDRAVKRARAGRFDARGFALAALARDWKSLELKQRMRRIAETLHAFVPGDYATQLAVLADAAPQFGGFAAMFFPDFVERYGLDEFDASVGALALFTRFSSSEFAVRPFIVRYGPRMMQVMARWARDDDEHLRRLASEGCRPRLPWAMALPEFKRDPAPVLPILEALKHDPSEYVRRSVANNLNDIAKDHPDLVLDLARRWLGTSQATDALVKHACRTLLKRGDARALALFGHDHGVDVRVRGFRLAARELRIGERLGFSFAVELVQHAAARLRLEYAVDFVKSAGTTSRKVFKIAERRFEPGARERYERSHRFQDFTTRKHYPGRHRVVILVNGVERGARTLELLPA